VVGLLPVRTARAFSSSLHDLELVPASGVISSHPLADNASR